MELIIPLAVGLIASLAANATLFYILLKSKKKRPNSIEATELLHDLTVLGQTLIRVERIDPSDFLIRSPRR